MKHILTRVHVAKTHKDTTESSLRILVSPLYDMIGAIKVVSGWQKGFDWWARLGWWYSLKFLVEMSSEANNASWTVYKSRMLFPIY